MAGAGIEMFHAGPGQNASRSAPPRRADRAILVDFVACEEKGILPMAIISKSGVQGYLRDLGGRPAARGSMILNLRGMLKRLREKPRIPVTKQSHIL